jgi:drug/metabolite transporter (DMT)-like permease
MGATGDQGVLHNPWWGAFLKVTACFFFSITNILIRGISSFHHEGGPLPFFEVAFLQNMVGMVWVAPWLTRNVFKKSLEQKNIHGLRVALSVLGVSFWYASLSFMPVAESVALSFTAPIFSLIGARFFLHERLGGLRGLAIVVSFLGALCISQAKSAVWGGLDSWYVWLPLLSAAFFAGTKLTGRVLAMNGESAREMSAMLYLFMVPISLLPALWVWRIPTSTELLWIVGLGTSSVFANVLLAKSYAYAEVSFLSPFGFAKFFCSLLLAYLLFNEYPKDWYTWIGFGFILLSIFLLSLEHKNLPAYMRRRTA